MQNTKTGMVLLATCVAALALSGCARGPQATRASATDINCMARAMYFESNRSSRDGMVAVGSVVMNRVESDAFPDDICAVVGQRNQFAPGVMSKSMRGQAQDLATTLAASVLAGERHPDVGVAKFFHAAWYQAHYNNMQYVVTAGGNAFYEKRRPEDVTTPDPLPQTEGLTG